MPRTRADILFIAPMPPPVHGQSVASAAMREFIENGGQITHVLDSGEQGQTAGRWRKIGRQIGMAWQVLAAPEHKIYLSVNAGKGIVLTSLLAAAARIRGKSIALHHHSYQYIGEKKGLMDLLTRAAGRGAYHITNCRDMAMELQSRYPAAQHALGYSNVGVVDADLDFGYRHEGDLVLGHISNLTEEKGLGRTIDCFRQVRKIWPETRLIVAGPDSDEFAKRAINAAMAEFGETFSWIGPVYGAAKKDYFHRLDVVLFPSLYPIETQGIVNLEAMACGKPVIAFAQCCIGGDIGASGGLAVAKSDDYNAATIGFLQGYFSEPENHARRARQRFEELLSEHEQQKSDLRAWFRS